jgi:queuine tRNA-ribosyltransferase
MLGAILLTTANLSCYGQLMADIRAAIAAGRFEDLRASMREASTRGDLDEA